jgi:hypothetical protein
VNSTVRLSQAGSSSSSSTKPHMMTSQSNSCWPVAEVAEIIACFLRTFR